MPKPAVRAPLTTWELQGPDGSVYEVQAHTIEEANAAFDSNFALNTTASDKEGPTTALPGIPTNTIKTTDREYRDKVLKSFDELPFWQKPLVAGGDVLTNTADAATAGGIRYMQDPATQKAMDDARIRMGNATVPSDIGGMLAGGELTNLAKYAAKVPGLVGTAARTALTGAEGAGWGALSALFNNQDVVQGAELGSGLSVLGKGVLSLLGKVVGKGARTVDTMSRSPEDRAIIRVAKEAEKYPDAAAKVAALGPEGMIADTGLGFQNILRSATNLSSETATKANTKLAAREAMQNETMSDVLMKESGLSTKITKTPEQVSETIHNTIKGKTHDLYEAAHKAGHDLPLTTPARGSGQMVHPAGFEDIFKSDDVQKAWLEAYPRLRNRVASGDIESADSVLAQLTETAQILKKKARLAKDPTDQSMYGNLASKLEETMDKQVSHIPELKAAKLSKAQEMERRDALELGSSLAKTKPSMGLLDKVKQINPNNKHLVQKGYALETKNRLSGAKNTPASLASMQSSTGKAVIDTVYDAKAPIVHKTLDDLVTMAATKKKIGGGTVSVKDLLEKHAGSLYSGGAGGLATMLATGNPTYAGLMAAISAIGAPAARKAMSMATAKTETRMAPYLEELTTGQVIKPHPGKGKYEKLYDKVPSVPITGLIGQLSGRLADRKRGAR